MDKKTLEIALEVVRKLNKKHYSKLKTAKNSNQRLSLGASCIATKEVEIQLEKLLEKCQK